MSQRHAIGADGFARPSKAIVAEIEQMMELGAAEHWLPGDAAPLWELIACDIANVVAAWLADTERAALDRAAAACDALVSAWESEQSETIERYERSRLSAARIGARTDDPTWCLAHTIGARTFCIINRIRRVLAPASAAPQERPE